MRGRFQFKRVKIPERIIKIKERILSDRQLAEVLKKNDLCRFVTRDIQPAHNTFNTLRKRLGPKGFMEIHKRFVLRAHVLGLREPDIQELPKHRKKGIILVADSTFLITCGSTRGKKDEQGRWHFSDESVAFTGKGHHSHKYPVGHKVHSLRTVSGIPMKPKGIEYDRRRTKWACVTAQSHLSETETTPHRY